MNGTVGALLQILVYFFLLLGILAAGLFFMRNGLGGLAQKNKGVRKLSINETRMLGNRQFLVVAEYEGKKMLIGVCPGRIDYLCKLGGGEAGEERFATLLPEKPE
ncbi:MAG: flagellar biosynthetic protein FliO [Chthoniobacteraceae bacterium]|nr:flagellar biosynthetic protein FliO [Chthoniobacteraceae bacterium]